MFRRCLNIPLLQSGEAARHADILMETLDREKSIDIDTGPDKRESAFSTDYLFSDAGGQMFGILVCRNLKGEEVVLRAFSGQYNSRWTAPGWVPPVIDPDEFDSAVREKDREIKNIDREIKNLESELLSTNTSDEISGQIRKLKKTRKKISQNLMKEIHSLYYLNNFKGERKLMSDVFTRKAKEACGPPVPAMPAGVLEAPRTEILGPPVPAMPAGVLEAPRTEILGPPVPAMPAGTGDCCAPKLLNYAAKEELIPLSLIEFYYGKDNKSGTKKHKHFYPPCTDKCGPILGFMMSGIRELHKKYSRLSMDSRKN